MAALESGLVARIKANSSFTTLVTDKIFPETGPSVKDLPVVVYKLSNEQRQLTLRGASGLVVATVDFEIFALDKADVRAIGDVLQSMFDGFRGYLSTVHVQSGYLDNIVSEYFPPLDASDSGIYCETYSFRFAYTETVSSVIIG